MAKKDERLIAPGVEIPLESSEGHWVKIREARWRDSRMRQKIFDRVVWEYEGTLARRLSKFSDVDLLETELWVTFEGSNLPGFEKLTPGKVDLGLFKDRLGELPEAVIYEWRSLVYQINPDWGFTAASAESA